MGSCNSHISTAPLPPDEGKQSIDQQSKLGQQSSKKDLAQISNSSNNINSNSNNNSNNQSSNINTPTNNEGKLPPGDIENLKASKAADDDAIAHANNHNAHPDVRVHAVVTGELDHDHNLALRVPLGQVTDEQLIAELAERDLDQNSRVSPDYHMYDHPKAMRIPLEAATDDELLAEVGRRRLHLHEEVNEALIFETYEMGKVIGHGASGKVCLVTHREKGTEYACKIILKDMKMNDAQSMSTEIEIMKRLRHKNVVAMLELYEAPQCLWMMLELVDGGDLRQYLNQHRQSYTEAQAATHLKQILAGVHYLHSMGVVHRDLKLENILLKRTEDSYDVKIADFGLSALVRIGEDGYHTGRSSRRKLYTGLHEPWGTAEYEAPELLNGAYGPQADIWAVGCMLYEMLSGAKAFARREDEKDFSKLYSRIRKGVIDFRK